MLSKKASKKQLSTVAFAGLCSLIGPVVQLDRTTASKPVYGGSSPPGATNQQNKAPGCYQHQGAQLNRSVNYGLIAYLHRYDDSIVCAGLKGKLELSLLLWTN